MPGRAGVDGTMDLSAVLAAVEAARTAWLAYQERVDALKEALRRSTHPGLAFELQRIEAYGALAGRDEGMGQSRAGWLDEIEQAARDAGA